MSKSLEKQWTTSPQTFFVSGPVNFESLLEQELVEWSNRLGRDSLTDLGQAAGGVEFKTSLAVGFALNHCTKIGHRVLLRIDSFKAREFSQLKKKLKQLPWNLFFGETPPQWKVSSAKSRLFHKKNIEQTCIEAFQEYRIGNTVGGKADDFQGAVYLRIDEDICTVSVDCSGEHLHKRGLKPFSTDAPLRENFAAGILQSIITSDCRSMMDPMCGSGTFLSEAHTVNEPIKSRAFSYQNFSVSKKVDKTLIEKMEPVSPPFTAYHGNDLDVEVAKKNLSKVDGIHWSQSDILKISPEKPVDLIVANPPYNERLETDGRPNKLYKDFIQHIEKIWQPKRYGLILPRESSRLALNANWATYKPLTPLEFSNNGIPVTFLGFESP